MTWRDGDDRLLVAALAVLCVVLAAVTVAPWLFDPADATADAAGRESQEAAPTPTPRLELPPIERFAALVERPIFTATRRSPPRRPGPGAAPGAAPISGAGTNLVLGRYRLTGVVVAPAKRLVLLKRPGDGKTIRVFEGETIDGWTLTQVSKTTLTLESGNRREEFLVRGKSKSEYRNQ